MNSQEETIRREKERFREMYRERKLKAIQEMEKHKQKVLQKKRMLSIESDTDLLIEKVLKNVGGLEKLLEKIGIEKVETVLRAHKINKLKKKL